MWRKQTEILFTRLAKHIVGLNRNPNSVCPILWFMTNLWKTSDIPISLGCTVKIPIFIPTHNSAHVFRCFKHSLCPVASRWKTLQNSVTEVRLVGVFSSGRMLREQLQPSFISLTHPRQSWIPKARVGENVGESWSDIETCIHVNDACDLCRPQTGRFTFTLSTPSPTHPYTVHMFVVYTSWQKAAVLGVVAVRH